MGIVQDKRFVMLRPAKCVVAKELYWGRGKRPKAEDNFAVDLFATLAREADVVLDVGAYTGIFTLVATAVNPSLKAHAFEVVPEVFRSLFDNCVRNDVLHRTTLHHIGLGDPSFVFKVPPESKDSALPSFYSGRLHFDSGTQIRFESLDSISRVLPEGKRILIKIDVEGTEADIFHYGQTFLSTFHPDMLCEVLADVADAPLLEQLLSPHGYRFYLVRGDGLQYSSSIAPDPRYRDWFFSTRGEDELRVLRLVAPRVEPPR